MSRQTIAVSVKASKLTARALAYVVAAVGRKIAKEHRKAQAPHGGQRIGKAPGRQLGCLNADGNGLTGNFVTYDLNHLLSSPQTALCSFGRRRPKSAHYVVAPLPTKSATLRGTPFAASGHRDQRRRYLSSRLMGSRCLSSFSAERSMIS